MATPDSAQELFFFFIIGLLLVLFWWYSVAFAFMIFSLLISALLPFNSIQFFQTSRLHGTQELNKYIVKVLFID